MVFARHTVRSLRTVVFARWSLHGAWSLYTLASTRYGLSTVVSTRWSLHGGLCKVVSTRWFLHDSFYTVVSNRWSLHDAPSFAFGIYVLFFYRLPIGRLVLGAPRLMFSQPVSSFFLSAVSTTQVLVVRLSRPSRTTSLLGR